LNSSSEISERTLARAFDIAASHASRAFLVMRKATLLHVGLRTAPVLGQEHHQMVFGLGEIVGVHGAQQLVTFDGLVERFDESLEERLSAHLIVERRFHAPTLMGCSRLIRVSTETCGCSSMVELQPSKLAMRVRSPSPAPRSAGKSNVP
jgi:hypothetical protein